MPTPSETRWNSGQDCLATLMTASPENIALAFTKCIIKPFLDSEHRLLLEYVKVMRPICVALNTLQGEHNCFLGLVLPVIVRLKARLNSLVLAEFDEFRMAILERIEARFGKLFDNDDYVLAAVTHPRFKLNWLSDEAKRVVVKQKLKSLIQSNTSSSSKAKTPNDDPDDFDYVASNLQSTDEIDSYLLDRSMNFDMLNKYTNVKKAFLKYNTPIPSSAPVERLFSIAALVLTTRRTKMSDTLFEELLLLKVHLKIDME